MSHAHIFVLNVISCITFNIVNGDFFFPLFSFDPIKVGDLHQELNPFGFIYSSRFYWSIKSKSGNRPANETERCMAASTSSPAQLLNPDVQARPLLSIPGKRSLTGLHTQALPPARPPDTQTHSLRTKGRPGLLSSSDQGKGLPMPTTYAQAPTGICGPHHRPAHHSLGRGAGKPKVHRRVPASCRVSLLQVRDSRQSLFHRRLERRSQNSACKARPTLPGAQQAPTVDTAGRGLQQTTPSSHVIPTAETLQHGIFPTPCTLSHCGGSARASLQFQPNSPLSSTLRSGTAFGSLFIHRGLRVGPPLNTAASGLSHSCDSITLHMTTQRLAQIYLHRFPLLLNF